jgi:glutathione S-transferase
MLMQAPAAAARLQARHAAAARGSALRAVASRTTAASRRCAATASAAASMKLYTVVRARAARRSPAAPALRGCGARREQPRADAPRPRAAPQPVSNFGARPRLVVAWKGLEAQVQVASPADLGGLKSAEYLALNPQGKMPLLVLPDGRALPESEVIVGYLLDVFSSVGPSLVPPTPGARATAALATRLHDTYLGPLQGAMYKEMEAAQRAAQLSELARQLAVLEAALDAGGPYVAGAALSSADAALFPTFVFYTCMLPQHFGWRGIFEGKPRLARWWAAMCADPAAAGVRADIQAGLAKWEEAQRWEKVRERAGAGVCMMLALTRLCGAPQLGITAQVADNRYQWAY